MTAVMQLTQFTDGFHCLVRTWRSSSTLRRTSWAGYNAQAQAGRIMMKQATHTSQGHQTRLPVQAPTAAFKGSVP